MAVAAIPALVESAPMLASAAATFSKPAASAIMSVAKKAESAMPYVAKYAPKVKGVANHVFSFMRKKHSPASIFKKVTSGAKSAISHPFKSLGALTKGVGSAISTAHEGMKDASALVSSVSGHTPKMPAIAQEAMSQAEHFHDQLQAIQGIVAGLR